MRSSSRFIATNNIEAPGRALEQIIQSPNAASWLENTHVDWKIGRLLEAPIEIVNLLSEIGGFNDTKHSLTPTALRLLGKLQIDLESAAKKSSLTERFDNLKQIAKGSNSIALKATNKYVSRTVVLKILYPVLPESAEAAIRELGKLEKITGLIAPIDSYIFHTTTASGDTAQLYCIVFPYIPGTTLDEYLAGRPPITPLFFEIFIRQIGGVLAKLEDQGIQHGDLHGANILVSSEEPSLAFTIIDPSPGLNNATPYRRSASDREWFNEHLAHTLLVLQRHLPTISIQKHLGPRLYSIISKIQGDTSLTFKEILHLLDVNPRYEEWGRRRSAFIAKKFNQPRPLGLLRWEEIADPAEAVELFEPYHELFKRVKTFGNSLIVGARGSGKSTYLAALAYFPGSKRKLVETSEIFGVLFSCRQGEFKQLSKEFICFDAYGQVAIKHVLVLKIIRRILRNLADGCDRDKLDCSGELTPLHAFVKTHMPTECSIARVDATPAAVLSNLADGVVRWEELEIRNLFNRTLTDTLQRRLNEAALLEFCELVKNACPTLATSQFYFLFDDAGIPNVPRETQHILNDLVTSSNAVYCVKLSAERYSYSLENSAGRTLEETHDLTSFDIASAYATEGGINQSRTALKEYFAQIIRKRLEHWNYPATDIAAYLGDQSKSSAGMIPIGELIERLAEGRKNAYYAGWEVVWQLADKTPRNLIELVSEVFANAEVLPIDGTAQPRASNVHVIRALTQDRAIRAVSNRRLRALEFTPGYIDVGNQKIPLGKHLYLCASSFGLVSHQYLTRHRNMKDKKRYDERLGLERNDTALLSEDARQVLELLVRYGVFDDSGLSIAFDDGQKKPVYVFNRIFCPAFAISFRRDANLRLSIGKLEMYLLKPPQLLKRGTAFLEDSIDIEPMLALWDVIDE